MCDMIRYFFISLHYVVNSNAKIDGKNDISKYMWVYLNIINISAYCITRKTACLQIACKLKIGSL